MRLTVSLYIVALLLLASRAQGDIEMYHINNAFVKAIVETGEGPLRERYFARDGEHWVLMLESGGSARTDPSVKFDGNMQLPAYTSARLDTGATGDLRIVVEGESGAVKLRKTISLEVGARSAHVVVSVIVTGRARIAHALSTYSFTANGRTSTDFKPLDFVFTPQLRPEADQVIADHVFRAPALMLQKGRRFAALIPDLASIDQKHRPLRTTADLQADTAADPSFSFGLQNWIAEPYALRQSHVYYTAPESLAATISDTTLTYAFHLFLNADAPKGKGYQDVVRFHWQRYGAVNMQASHGPQRTPFAVDIRKAWYEFLPAIALDTVYRGRPVTLLRQGRLAWSNQLPAAADNDSWFNVWFNSLRTAYGMYVHGRNAHDRGLMEQAERVLTLALLAPQHEGIAPAIFYIDSAGGHWVADQAWGGIGRGTSFPMFANAWTCYWLLQWTDLVPERSTEIHTYTKKFADFLVKKQLPTGVIPSWYDPVTLEPEPELRDLNAETAGAALFLAEYARRSGGRAGGKQYLLASERAMDFITAHVVPQRKWFDNETFFSCSRKPLGFFDAHTQQHPQNTLSMHQAAEAWLALYEITGKRQYKQRGIEALDYLCLYQQVWSPAWLSCELFGGFGVQNTDGEWSDSRQGYFAVTLMKYYELTGRKEYFERGVAALRAMFALYESPTSPRTAENYAHSALDKLAGVTGIHWGTGSSVVSVHQIVGTYGDAHINVKAGWGVGIDGCRIPQVTVRGTTISITLLDNVAAHRTIRITFAHLEKSSYTVVVNGVAMGVLSRKTLLGGIPVQL